MDNTGLNPTEIKRAIVNLDKDMHDAHSEKARNEIISEINKLRKLLNDLKKSA